MRPAGETTYDACRLCGETVARTPVRRGRALVWVVLTARTGQTHAAACRGPASLRRRRLAAARSGQLGLALDG